MSKGVFEYGRMQKTTLYPTDLTDEQWNLLQLALPPRKTRKSRGRPPADLRRICSALLYFVRSGCAWRLLPRDFGPWKTIYHYFWLWTKQGCWKIIHDLLREAVRKAAGKRSQPTAAILDSQTVRSADQAGERGYDAAKKTKGIKRHILVDTLGLLLAVVVTAANFDDGTHAALVLAKLKGEQYPRLKKIFADNKYNNKTLQQWMADNQVPYTIEIGMKPDGESGFKPVKIRWVVEQSHACVGRCRRLSKDYERLTSSSETWIQLSAIQRMLRRSRPDLNQPQAAFKYPKRSGKVA